MLVKYVRHCFLFLLFWSRSYHFYSDFILHSFPTAPPTPAPSLLLFGAWYHDLSRALPSKAPNTPQSLYPSLYHSQLSNIVVLVQPHCRYLFMDFFETFAR